MEAAERVRVWAALRAMALGGDADFAMDELSSVEGPDVDAVTAVRILLTISSQLIGDRFERSDDPLRDAVTWIEEQAKGAQAEADL
jgi:hypothetical protein